MPVINGTTAADTLTGGAEPDTITGGLGADSMTGGAGFDLYVIGSSDSSPRTMIFDSPSTSSGPGGSARRSRARMRSISRRCENGLRM